MESLGSEEERLAKAETASAEARPTANVAIKEMAPVAWAAAGNAVRKGGIEEG